MCACDRDDGLYVVLKIRVKHLFLYADEARLTSTQSGPPWPCKGDSTHFKLHGARKSAQERASSHTDLQVLLELEGQRPLVNAKTGIKSHQKHLV